QADKSSPHGQKSLTPSLGTSNPASLRPQHSKAADLPGAVLRTPLTIGTSYASPFAVIGHHDMNGALVSPGGYTGVQSGVVAAYGRTPMVGFEQLLSMRSTGVPSSLTPTQGGKP
ncbi:hypothetical protein FKM82_017217, partial [Ascaphus truei]